MEFLRREVNGVVFLTAPGLEGVCHGFSTRLGGVSQGHLASLNLRFEGDFYDPENSDPEIGAVRVNYRRFCDALGVDMERVALSKQVHQDTVRVVTADDAGKGLSRARDYTADGLVTDVPGLPLFVFSADCITVLLFDPARRAVGAVHAGWRGTALGIVKKAVETMTAAYGTDPADLRAAIGPGIGPCCFETHGDVPQALLAGMGEDARPFIAPYGEEKFHVDLKGVNRRWLELAGVRQIDVCDLCTACRGDLFWSHRKLGSRRGVQVSAIALEAAP